jgi:hypothetical protein
MKHSLIIIFSVLYIFNGFAVPDNANPASNQMRIKIGSSTFTATRYDNATATAFKGMLPMTIKMSELNGNEKYYDLSVDLPTNTFNPGKIQSGDLMIYGSNTLVIFYNTFFYILQLYKAWTNQRYYRACCRSWFRKCNGYL